MKHKTYLRTLRAITCSAHLFGLEYIKSYAYKGPRVTRLKFWGTHNSRLAKKFVEFINENKLDKGNISHAIYQSGYKPTSRHVYGQYAWVKVYLK